MKKRIFSIIAGALVLGGTLYALSTYTATFINESALAYSRVFSLDLNSVAGRDQGVNSLSATVTASTAPLSSSSFTDGTKSAGSFTVSSLSNLSTTTAADNITVPADSQLVPVKATDQLTVVSTNGLSGAYITFNGINLINGRDWFSTSLTTGTAQSIATLLNKAPGIVASRAGSVVYATATVAGLIGNKYTLSSSSPSALSVAHASFTGGRQSVLQNATVTINGKVLRNGYDWSDASQLSTTTARSIAAALNHITGIVSTNTASVVYATATVAGSAANSYTLTASTVALVVANATFTGGTDNAVVSINGVALTQGVDWLKGASTTLAANHIAAAINANSSLSSIVVATNTGSVVYATSSVAGLTNYTLSSSIPASIAASGTKMTGGTAVAINTANSSLNLPTSGFTTGLALLYTKTAGSNPANLTANTTYYAIFVDANDIKLATSQSNAVAGTNITISTTNTAGGGSFTLAPLAYAGTASWKWQGSNDNSNWVDLVVTSVTFSSPFAARTDAWDFTPYDYRYLRLNFTAPTTGGVTIQSTVNGKNSL